MANEQNLVRGKQAHKLTAEEQSAGGKASGEARRKKRELRIALEMLLEKEYTDNKGNKRTGAELLAYKQFEKALEGDTRAFETVRDTAGQKPIDKIMVTEVDQEVVDEVERAVLDDE